MIIRREQMQALEEVQLPEFEDSIVAHLKDFSPLHSESLGEVGIRTLIRVGMERAKQHGFTYRGTVKFYIETIILLGIDFHTDPQYPGAGKILRDPSILDQTQQGGSRHGCIKVSSTL